MAKKIETTRKAKVGGNMEQIESGAKSRKGVQTLDAFYTPEPFIRLDEMIDQSLYLVKLEPITSEQFGEGFRLYLKDYPNAAETMTAATFGMNTVRILDQVWENSNHGERISLDSPVKLTVRKAGRSITFE